ncbi:hypothetical protein ACFXEL_35090 [Streptomyces sp. NPDC059382]|uniref:hypothetical protein n=1 Tax=Streptomyces sp. NPDC059382 TaxID=3346816 RepID=UPI003679D43B
MRIRRILKNRQCKRCDTFNGPLRRTCMACLTPLGGAPRHQTRAAAAVRRAAGVADSTGRWATLALALVTIVRQGPGVDLHDLMPTMAVYGVGQLLAYLLEDLAERIAPGPTWEEAAEGLRQTEKKLRNSGSLVLAVGDLNRHGGVAPIAGIMRALAARAMYEKETCEEGGDVQEADAQERLERALRAAADEMDADMARSWI